ncbi:MAG: pyruvate dehydrogenase complex dihydrolipoamide acetyltransferase [Acidobacteriota bacterium]|nr:pyruvate dehydrogenase complex dihydrolipoamide acetyltransferase [Acidobacteriota bacterium]
MATQVVMPKLSPTMEEGQLSRWLKNEGESVSVGEPLAEIDTDKATMEAQALTTGVLRKILVPAGQTVPLGQVIAIIGEPDEDIADLISKAESGAAGAENKKSIEENVESGQYGAQQELAKIVADGARTQATIQGAPLTGDVGAEPEAGAAGQPPAPPPTSAVASAVPATQPSANGQRGDGRLIVSPIAARMAAEAGINLQTLAGSGPGGRIVKRDIETAISNQAQSQQQTAQQPLAEAPAPPPAAQAQAAQPIAQPAPPQQPEIEGASAYRDEPLTTMRSTIARRLTSSIGPVPHFFLTTEIEMDRTAELRRSLNELDKETKISFNDIIVKVAAVALIQHPQVNASFQEKAVRYYERADIGVAVAIEDGLITPIIRGADQKAVGRISREVRELAERARNRKLQPNEYTGATFSISNLGMLGIDEFTAVINPPEAAILAIGAVQPKPVVREGEVMVRQMMRVTMSCDHRVIDGATGAQFLQTFKKILENPLLLMI